MGRDKNLISVTMATYNGEKYLKEQLDSIYKQTYPHIEVVVSDDSSTDKTPDILKEYHKRYGLKFSINKKQLGFVKNFEKAILMSKGDYIALSDQDDIWYPEKLDVLMKEIGDYSLICSDAELIDDNGNMILSSFQKFSGNYVETDDQFKFFVFRNYVTGCTSLIKREVIDKALPIPAGIRYHDWWFANIASIEHGVKYIDKKLIKYRQHIKNDTGANRIVNILRKVKEYKKKKKEGLFDKEISSIKAMLQYKGFTEKQRAVINDRLQFYENLFNSIIHFSSFSIAVKYHNYMLAGRNWFYKLAFILASLVK